MLGGLAVPFDRNGMISVGNLLTEQTSIVGKRCRMEEYAMVAQRDLIHSAWRRVPGGINRLG